MTTSTGRREAVHLVPLAPEHYRRTPWKNGGGVAVDIADAYRPEARQGDWAGMIWRFGRTGITRPGPFSDLAGFDRVQAVIAGSGLVLKAEHGPVLDLAEPFRPVRFPGEWAIASELRDGPVEVLNLIGDRSLVLLDLRFLRAGDRAEAGPGEHVLYAPSGGSEVEVEGGPLALAPDGAARFAADAPVGIAVASGLVALASVTPTSRRFSGGGDGRQPHTVGSQSAIDGKASRIRIASM